MTRLTKKALSAAILLTLIGTTFGVTTQVSADDYDPENDSIINDGEIDEINPIINHGKIENRFTIAGWNGNVSATGEYNRNISIVSKDVNYAVYARTDKDKSTPGTVTLGDSDTESITISNEAKMAYGIESVLDHSKVTLNGDKLTINVHSTGTTDGWAVGMQAQSNDMYGNDTAEIIDNAKETIINATTEDSTPDNGEYKNVGIVALSGGRVYVNNNLTINAGTALSTRGNSLIEINKDGTGTVKLNGNIDFDYNEPTSHDPIDSTVTLNLTNADSYFKGSVHKTGDAPTAKTNVTGMNLSLSNGAAWTPADNSFVNNLTLKDNGQIDLSGNAKTVDVLNSLTSDNGVVTTDSLNSQIVLASAAENKVTSLTVKGTSALADEIASDSTAAQKLANTVASESTGKSIATTVVTDPGVIAGAYEGTVNADGTVTGVQHLNLNNQAISNMAALSLMTWRQENNDMNKRLGEIRDSKGEAGVWARMARGESEYNANGIKNQYNYYQLGYDHKISNNWILGGAFTYTDGESSFASGSGTNKHTGLAVYGSQLRDDGSFIDLIAKYAHMRNKFYTFGGENGIGNGSYNTDGFAFSAEYGKRFTADSGFWIEPQAELTYGTVDSADFTSSKGAHVHQDNVDSLVGRLGFSLGKNIRQGNVYARLSYLYDFKGDANMNMSRGTAESTFDEDLGGSWWEYGIGANLNLGHDTHFYVDLERAMGGHVNTPWQWNAGIRYAF